MDAKEAATIGGATCAILGGAYAFLRRLCVTREDLDAKLAGFCPSQHRPMTEALDRMESDVREIKADIKHLIERQADSSARWPK